ncbi:BapA/Bap/LapF family prefix-like domain-containing protein, partial [Citrobacter braakii]|uniref:BapA/Bap/LapF family prefix-like domain-containing protein n=1 Tax=Citrobacter braakii TaxID=57706 RepID=UPI00117C8DF8
MRLLAVVSKLTGVSTNVEASEVTLSSPSIVKLSVSREEVSQLTRVNQDLVVTLRSGETITIKNFYLGKGEAQNQLVLEDSNGALWWVQDTDGAFHFQHLDDLTPLMTAEGSHEGGAVWPWVLGGIAVAGGIGLAAGGGSDGGWVSMLILNAGDMPPVPDWFVAVAVKACCSSDNWDLEVHVQLPLPSASTLSIIVP